MSRIYWDTMLFIYLLEDHPTYSQRVGQLLDRSYRRGDTLHTSYLALGELMTGAEKPSQPQKALAVREVIREMGFTCLAFDEGAVAPFRMLRAGQKVKIANSVHLACAASAGIDLFLTGDEQLVKLDVPGIQFIADFNTPVL